MKQSQSSKEEWEKPKARLRTGAPTGKRAQYIICSVFKGRMITQLNIRLRSSRKLTVAHSECANYESSSRLRKSSLPVLIQGSVIEGGWAILRQPDIARIWKLWCLSRDHQQFRVGTEPEKPGSRLRPCDCGLQPWSLEATVQPTCCQAHESHRIVSESWGLLEQGCVSASIVQAFEAICTSVNTAYVERSGGAWEA